MLKGEGKGGKGKDDGNAAKGKWGLEENGNRGEPKSRGRGTGGQGNSIRGERWSISPLYFLFQE